MNTLNLNSETSVILARHIATVNQPSGLVEDWSDERSSGGDISVTLIPGFCWGETDGDHIKSFETVAEARQALAEEPIPCHCKYCDANTSN